MDPMDRKLKKFFLQELSNELPKAEKEAVPGRVVRAAQALMKKNEPPLCPHCRKPITPFKAPVGRQQLFSVLWLALAAGSFLLSFRFHSYFLQFLALALFFGTKWAVDRRAMKTQILIYKALKETEEADTKLRDVAQLG